jgi:hypothetical protein
MPGKRPEPSPAAASASATSGVDGAHLEPDERVGPLAIARRVKADGRALILYSRAEPESR